MDNLGIKLVYGTCMWKGPAGMYVTGFAKRGLIHASNFQIQGAITQLVVYLQLWNFVGRLCYHWTKVTANFNLIA